MYKIIPLKFELKISGIDINFATQALPTGSKDFISGILS